VSVGEIVHFTFKALFNFPKKILILFKRWQQNVNFTLYRRYLLKKEKITLYATSKFLSKYS